MQFRRFFIRCVLVLLGATTAPHLAFAQSGVPASIASELGCANLTPVPEITTRLRGNTLLFACRRGADLSHKTLSYIEMKPGGHVEYRGMATFAARFGPFNTEPLAMAAALAFTDALPDIRLWDLSSYQKVANLATDGANRPMDGGYSIVTYDIEPHSGQCARPAIYQQFLQISADGSKKIMRREKIYEHNQKEKVCVD